MYCDLTLQPGLKQAKIRQFSQAKAESEPKSVQSRQQRAADVINEKEAKRNWASLQSTGLIAAKVLLVNGSKTKDITWFWFNNQGFQIPWSKWTTGYEFK